MLSQEQIDRELTKIKSWYWLNWPLCIFCGHEVRRKEGGQLAHLIRRSETTALQTCKLNTGIAHYDCHSIFDDNPDQALYLPRIIEVMYIIWKLDADYFYRLSSRFPELNEVFELFPEVPDQRLEHHGELITLQYLIR